jgi:hypothetical protein
MPELPGLVVSSGHHIEWRKSLKSAAVDAMRYAADVNLMGATGFDVGCEPSGAYRGAVPSLIMLQTIVANDDNYALAA